MYEEQGNLLVRTEPPWTTASILIQGLRKVCAECNRRDGSASDAGQKGPAAKNLGRNPKHESNSMLQ
jgi:hypothetical protein